LAYIGPAMKKGLLTEEESQLVIGAIPLQALPPEVSKYLSRIGRKGGKTGGKATTKRKADAARANGHKGGRPRKTVK